MDDFDSDDDFSIEASSSESENSENHSEDDDDYSGSELNDPFESDDDLRGCCHWSKEQPICETIDSQNGNGNTLGKPSQVFQDDTTPANIVELVLNDEFLDICLEATNEHARNDQEFQTK